MDEYLVKQIPRGEIFWPAQERKHFGQAELDSMAATIRVHGILEAIGVFPEGETYVGLWGQRRWMAAELAGLDLIPAVVRPKPTTELEKMEIRLLENLSRENLRPLEQSAAFEQYMKIGGLSGAEVAKRLGIEPGTVSKSVTLLRLSEQLRQQVDAGAISPSAGYALAAVSDPNLQAELGAQVASGALTRDALVRRIKASKRPPVSATSASRSRITAKLSGDRLVTLVASDLTVDSVIATLEDLLTRCRAARTKKLALRTMLSVLADEAKESSQSPA